MPETPTRPSNNTDPATAPTRSPTLEDEFLQSACTIARGRTTWTPGPGPDTEDLPWLKGAAAA
jgi:hypothetical protein